ncbi:MAG TPA: tetratricopeptide repeat protein [Candidatus Acidoferrum sp.]|nr:tetratricopeptide repeat protein [Candidatus Acidoferrum sp.]
MAARFKAAVTAAMLGLLTLWPPVASAQNVENSGLEAGRRAYELSDYEKAINILLGADTKNPRNGEVLFLLAKSHFELRQYDAAVASAERAVAVAPGNSSYHELLGRSLGEKASKSSWFSALSLARKAQQEFETAVRLNPRNYGAFQALIEFDCAAPGIAGGGEDKALAKIEQLAAMDDAEGHYAAGNCRRQKKDYPAAEAEFDKALINAKSPELIFDIGDYALKRDQPQRLLAVVDAGQKASPGDPRAKFYRAGALILQRQKPDEAESLLREYLRVAPRRTGFPRPALAHDWLGRLFEDQNNRNAAAREYATSLLADPKDKTAQEALRRLGKA